MDLHKIIRSRRTIHEFSIGAVSKEALLRAVEAATYAPNHKLTNPWRFIWVGPETREKLAAIGVGVKCTAEASDEMKRKVRQKLLTPGGLVVACNRKSPGDAFREKEDYAAVCCAIQNLMLSLWADGIGSKWGTGGLTRQDSVYDLLKIHKEKENIAGFIWCGVPADIPVMPTRQGVSEIFREVP